MLPAFLSLMALCAPVPAGTYQVDPERTYLLVLLRPDDSRLLSGLSHKHVIRATRPSGTIRYDPARPDQCRVEIDARVRDLEVDAPEMRKKVGYDDALDDADRADVRENMLDDDQLDAGRHRDIRFRGIRCEPVDGGIRVKGQLTVRGIPAPLALSVNASFSGGRLRARTEFTLEHAAFGFEPYSAALGTLANDDWLKFVIEVEARRRGGGSKSAVGTSTTSGP